MWTWFWIAVLARVLTASHEVDQYPSPSSLSSEQIAEDAIAGEGGESRGEELSGQGTAKPEETRIRQSEWKNDHIFQGMNPYGNSISSLLRELGSSASKIFPNGPKVPEDPEDQRDKRSSNKQAENRPPESWISWTTSENKALPFRNVQDPWQEIKKSRAFSPWGGKRVTVYGQGAKVRRPIRIPFNSWGGKRSFSPSEEKRTRFSSWGGKRSRYIGAEEKVKNEGEKRTKFNAWGGKRSKNVERDDDEIKRNRFNAWGGKRNYKSEKRTPEVLDEKKNVFNAWGGKRFFADNEVNMEDEEGLRYGVWNEKERDMFRVEKPGENIEVASINDVEEDDENGYDKEENRNENAIIPSSSRDIEITELPKKKGARDDYVHKSLFNPWGGKKRSENDIEKIATGINFIIPSESQHHLARFWPWGG